MRVLLTADAVGGVWTYALDLARALRPLGVEAVLAVLGPAPGAMQREAAEAGGVRVIETGLPLDWLAPDEAAVRRAGQAIAALALAEGVDLVQINQPALAAEPMPVPVVVAMHSCVATWWAAMETGPLPADFRWQTALVRAGLARATTVVAPSAAFAGAVQGAYALQRAPRVVHNGRSPLVRHVREPLNFAFTAGRLWDRGKNIVTLDAAAAMLPVPLHAAGPLAAPYGERVALAHAIALGALDEAGLEARLAHQPVFASAARYEPFGLAVLEAAQAGCALVLSDIPTFRELWEGVATFVQPDDAKGFANAITTLIRDPAQRGDNGAAAWRRASRYTVQAMAGGMAALYAETLATAARERAAA